MKELDPQFPTKRQKYIVNLASTEKLVHDFVTAVQGNFQADFNNSFFKN
jgi:hypothetical protein